MKTILSNPQAWLCLDLKRKEKKPPKKNPHTINSYESPSGTCRKSTSFTRTLFGLKSIYYVKGYPFTKKLYSPDLPQIIYNIK